MRGALSGVGVTDGQAVVRTESVGTLATISDWYQGTDGLLGITAFGGERFRLLGMQRQSDGLNVGDPDVLADCAAEVGFDRDEAYEFLASGRGTDEVRAELETASDSGISAVPTYVINGRWAIPGAQEPETFAQVLRKMADQAVAEHA